MKNGLEFGRRNGILANRDIVCLTHDRDDVEDVEGELRTAIPTLVYGRGALNSELRRRRNKGSLWLLWKYENKNKPEN